MIDIGEKAVELALHQGAEEAEAFVLKSTGTSLAIEKNALSVSSTHKDFGIGVRTITRDRIGFAYCSDPTELKRTVADALLSARRGKESITLPKPEPLSKVEGLYDKSIGELSVEQAAEMVVEIINSALDVEKDMLVTRGGLAYGVSEFALVNSKGVEIEDRGTGVVGDASTVFRGKTISTGFEVASSRNLDIECTQIGNQAAQLAMRTQKPAKYESKRTKVLLTPYALASLLEFITVPALYGDATERGESIYSEKLGEKVASEYLTLAEDSALSEGLNSWCADDEGTPSRRIELITKGELQGYLYDQTTALKYGKRSTSNGVRVERFSRARTFKTTPSIKSRNLVLEGERESTNELIEDTREGILVYDVLGAHTSNPASGDFSVNTSILFQIKNGELAKPLRPLMLSGNFGECLKNISGIGDDTKKLYGSLTPISVVVPTVRAEDVNVVV